MTNLKFLATSLKIQDAKANDFLNVFLSIHHGGEMQIYFHKIQSINKIQLSTQKQRYMFADIAEMQ